MGLRLAGFGGPRAMGICVIARLDYGSSIMGKLGQRLLNTLRVFHHCSRRTTLHRESAQKIDCALGNTRPRKERHHPQLLGQLVRQPKTTFSPSALCGVISQTQIRTMSSDADYAAFLDKANQDTGSGEVKEASQKSYGTKSVNTAVPNRLKEVKEYYISESDEPFEPVALEFEGSSVSSGKGGRFRLF